MKTSYVSRNSGLLLYEMIIKTNDISIDCQTYSKRAIRQTYIYANRANRKTKRAQRKKEL